MTSSTASARDSGLIPLADRLRYTQLVRVALVAAAIVAAFAVAHGPLPRMTVVVLGAVHVALTAPSLFAWRLRRSFAIGAFGAALLLDGLFLAAITYAAGNNALVVLLLAHVVSTTLLGSFRTGLKIALWHSLLIGSAYQLQHDGLVKVDTVLTSSTAAVMIAGVWIVTMLTAAAGAANERELRRRNYDLHALARLGTTIEQTTQVEEIAQLLINHVAEDFGVTSVALAAAADGEPTLLAAIGTQPVSRPLRPGDDALVAETMRSGVTRRVLAPGAAANPWLHAMMPGARRLVLVPLHAEGRTLGVLVFAYDGGSTRIERRVVEMVEQFVAHSTLALQNAWLLERIGALAATDGLTGIANRRTFDDVLAREAQRAGSGGGSLSLMLIDIDHFKKLNDTYGHQEGDRTLRAVAQVVAAACRATDLAARYGGEEFVVVLPGSDAQSAFEAAERFRLSVMELPEPKVTISVGVSTFAVSGRTAPELIAAADAALYVSKHNGRNQVTLATAADNAVEASETSWVPAQAAPALTALDDPRPAAF
jgi:diguanylate cyclase (GGDEF)-like protein